MKIGAPCESVDAAARKVIADAGFGPGYKVPGLPHRTGHGIGLECHEWTNFVKGNKTPIQPGMCFSDEPMIAIPASSASGTKTACTSPTTARTSSRSRPRASRNRRKRTRTRPCSDEPPSTALLLALPALAPSAAQQPPPLSTVLDELTFRNMGPFRTGGWITDIAVPDAPPHDHLYTMYAASRSGGLWKTTNGGVTWSAITDSVDLAAIGAVAIASSNPSIVWVGSGDQANARSSYSGKGVFKSTDAGATWQFMGLPDSHHIARSFIHSNPDIVFTYAAIGHLFSTVLCPCYLTSRLFILSA